MSARVKTVVHIDAPFEEVSRRLCDFGSLAEWHPGFVSCEVEGEGVGALRRCSTGDGVVVDRLDEVGDEGRGYRYTQLDGPVPAARHEGYLWASRNDDGTATVEWAAKISGSPVGEPILAAMLEAITESGLDAAKASLED